MAKSIFRVLSGVSGNLAAGWLGLIFIVPGFASLDSTILTNSIAFASINIILAIMFERLSQYEY